MDSISSKLIDFYYKVLFACFRKLLLKSNFKTLLYFEISKTICLGQKFLFKGIHPITRLFIVPH